MKKKFDFKLNLHGLHEEPLEEEVCNIIIINLLSQQEK